MKLTLDMRRNGVLTGGEAYEPGCEIPGHATPADDDPGGRSAMTSKQHSKNQTARHRVAELAGTSAARKACTSPAQILSNLDDDWRGMCVRGRAVTRMAQVRRASAVIVSMISDGMTNDAVMDSWKPNKPTVKLMMRAPSVETV